MADIFDPTQLLAQQNSEENKRRIAENPVYKVPTFATGSTISPGNQLRGVPQNPLQEAMTKVNSATTPDELLAASQNLLGQQAAYEAKKTEDAFVTATKAAGLPQLEQRLQQEILADQSDPNYTGYDSKITLEARNRLERAKGESRIIARQIIETDPELARLKVETTFLANKASSNALTMMQRDERLNEKDYEKGLMLPPSVDAYLTTMKPVETAGLSKGRKFDYARLGLNKEEQQVASVADSPEALLELTLAGNDYAKKFLVKSNTNGDPLKEHELSSELDEFSQLAIDPRKAFDAAKGNLASAADKTELQAMLTKFSGTKDEQAVAMNYARRQALEAMTMRKIKLFDSVKNWDLGELEFLSKAPPTADLYRRAIEKKGGNIQNLTYKDLEAELSLLPANQFEAAKELLINTAAKEAEKINATTLWKVPSRYDLITRANANRAKQEMGISGVMPGFMESLIASTTFGQVSLPQLEAAANPPNPPNPPNISTGVISR